MPPQTAKSLMKEFRASFRRKKVVVDPASKVSAEKALEEEELAKLTEMKENLGDQIPPIYCDADLMGFLRARSLNVKEAEKLLKLDENIKRFLRLDEFRLPTDKQCYNFTGVIGFDKEGCLVRIMNVGGADTKGLIHMVSTINALKILICMVTNDLALQEEENKKTGQTCKQLVYIINLEELSMSQVSFKPFIDMGMQILKLLQDHYHDVLKRVLFINAPSFFSSVFKLFKPVIQDSLQQKIKIFDVDSTKGELLKKIDADVLPEHFGGNRVDVSGDPKCKEFLPYGGVVPESCFASNFMNPEDKDVVVTTVPAGATLNFRFPIKEMGSIVEWHIQGKDNDIGLAVYHEPFSSSSQAPKSRKKKEEDMSKFEQLTPIIRSQCHISPEQGSTILWFTGNLILHFDNSYSWMNSKDVFFKIIVKPPTETEKNYVNSVEHATKGLGQVSLGQH